MRRAEKQLKELRAELKRRPAQPSNESAINQALEACIAEVRRLNATDQVSLPRDTLEAFVEYFENTPAGLMDDEKRSLLQTLKDTLGDR